jgi:hypothetical protein
MMSALARRDRYLLNSSIAPSAAETTGDLEDEWTLTDGATRRYIAGIAREHRRLL